MGLFDKIKDNAKTISMKAIESTREYDENYVPEQQAAEAAVNAPAVIAPAEIVEEVAEEIISEEQFTETPVDNEDSDKKAAAKPAEAEAPKPQARRSKVIEVSKAEYEQSKKTKQQAEEQEKTKQAAKERLAKDYKPSYKSSKPPAKDNTIKTASSSPSKQPQATTVGFADVTPGKFVDPTKAAIYARERAALTALASRRKLDGSVPLYVASHMSFKTRVFVDRIEYSGSFGKTSLPVDQVAWIKLRSTGTGVIIETIEGKRFVMVVKPTDRLAFAEAVLKVQSLQPKRGKFKDTKTIRIDELDKFSEGVDEIEKLAKLYDKGILSQEEFDKKKKQILGI